MTYQLAMHVQQFTHTYTHTHTHTYQFRQSQAQEEVNMNEWKSSVEIHFPTLVFSPPSFYCAINGHAQEQHHGRHCQQHLLSLVQQFLRC